MALIKYGGGVVQMSGSIAGTTFARNRFGNYARPRTKPVNPGSSGQSEVRDALSMLTAVWAAILTAGQRTAWGTYAAAVSMTNRLGEVVYLTGFNHFIRSNTQFLNKFDQYQADGPPTLSLPAKDTQFAATGSVATQLISIAFDVAQGWNHEALGTMQIYMGVPRQVTRNFFNGPWKYGTSLIGNVAVPLTSPQTFTAPMTLVLGQLVTCYARIRRADGRLSEPFTSTFIVAA